MTSTMSVLSGFQNLTISGSTINVLSHGDQTNTTSISGVGDFVNQRPTMTAAAADRIDGIPTTSGKKAFPQLTTMFTGREDVLQRLARHFHHSKLSIALRRQLIFVLYGLGGAGKTQIMAKFVDEYADQFCGVYYVDASTLETIQSSFEDIARNASAGKTVDDALRWFVREHKEWLLLIDNADDPQIDLRRFLPPCRHGNVIITSRNPACRIHAPDSNCNVSGMRPDDAIELLLKWAMTERSERNRALCASICEELGYLALAISQAGAYIAQSCSLSDYLQIYQEDRVELLQKHAMQTADDYKWTVYTTWEMSLKRLTPTAAMFLRLCAFMHYDGISRAIFQNATTASDHESFQDAYRFLNNFRSETGEWSNIKFLDHINELASYSLIDIDTENHAYSIHPLVHTWARHRTSPAEQSEAQTCMVQILALSVPDEFSAESLAFQRSLLPHIDEFRNSIKALDIADKFQKVYVETERWKAAEGLQKLIMEARRKQCGDEHPDTLRIMVSLSCSYREQGQWKEAEELQLQALGARKLLGDEHPDMFVVMNSLATTYWIQGRLKEAEELYSQVLEARRRLLGDEHSDTLVSMANLACIYRTQGLWNEAEKLELRVLEASRILLGEEHPETLFSMAALACTYGNQGRLKEAEELELLVLAAKKKRLGNEHTRTLLSMANLACTYRLQGRLKEAEDLELQVIEVRKRLLGNEHPETIRTLANLACTYRLQGRLKEAEDLDLQGIEVRKRLLGNEHPDTIRGLANLACTYRLQGRLREAEDLDLQVIEVRRRLLGNEHPDTIRTLANLASTYKCQDRWKEAEELELVVVDVGRRVFGDQHPEAVFGKANLAHTYRSQSKWKEAEEMELQVLAIRRKLLGDDHFDTLLSLSNLAIAYQNQDRWKEAEDLQLQVLQVRRRSLGDEHLNTLVTMSELARTFRNQNRWKEAEELDLRVLTARRKLLSDEHPDTVLSKAVLAYAYFNQGQWKEAEEMELQVLETRKKLLGDEHPDTLHSMDNLALIRTQGRMKEVEEMELRIPPVDKQADTPPASNASVAHPFAEQKTQKKAKKGGFASREVGKPAWR